MAGLPEIAAVHYSLCGSLTVAELHRYSVQRHVALTHGASPQRKQAGMYSFLLCYTLFRRTSPALLSVGATNELLLENNVACDMPRQIPYMSWLILIMPLSMLVLNCAISFGKRRAGELFYSNRSA